jgi:hypothetical protein
MRLSLFLVCCAALPLAAQERAIDAQRSTVTIHVGKTGLLSVTPHDHIVSAPIASGTVREGSDPHIEFTVATRDMKVLADPDVDAKSLGAIQNDMENKVLETKKFPEIVFHSTHVKVLAPGQWRVEGGLSLHGVTKPVVVIVKLSGGVYFAHFILKLSDFAIKPTSVGGGTIKVKNEVLLDFQIITVQNR